MDWLKFKLMRSDFKDAKSAWKQEMGSFYDIPATDIDLQNKNALKQHAGKVSVIMNTACFCGYTAGSYPALQKIYDKYRDKGMVALGFPCNQFGGQEPNPEPEIKETVTKMGITFPIMAKIDVNGANTHPVYTFLKKCFPGDVLWNFSSKFVVNRAGVPVRRFEKESWEEIDEFVGKLVAEAAPVPAAAAATAAAAGSAAAPAPAAAAGEPAKN